MVINSYFTCADFDGYVSVTQPTVRILDSLPGTRCCGSDFILYENRLISAYFGFIARIAYRSFGTDFRHYYSNCYMTKAALLVVCSAGPLRRNSHLCDHSIDTSKRCVILYQLNTVRFLTQTFLCFQNYETRFLTYRFLSTGPYCTQPLFACGHLFFGQRQTVPVAGVCELDRAVTGRGAGHRQRGGALGRNHHRRRRCE